MAGITSADVDIFLEGWEKEDDLTVTLTLKDPADNVITSDSVHIHIGGFDIVGHQHGTTANPGQEVSEADEDDPEKLRVFVNIDDDNSDGVQDKLCGPLEGADDDVVKVLVKTPPVSSGTAKLLIEPSDVLRVFKEPNQLLAHYSVNMANPQGDLSDLANEGEVELFVEGLEKCSSVTMALVLEDAAGNEVDRDELRLSVVGVNIVGHEPATMANFGNVVSESEEDDPAKLIAFMNVDDDNGNAAPDNGDAIVDANDDDIVTVILKPLPVDSGTMELEVTPDTAVRLFKNPQALLSDYTVDMAQPQGYLAGLANGQEVKIYLEGTAVADDVQLHFSLKDTNGDIIDDDTLHLKVSLAVDIDADGWFRRSGGEKRVPSVQIRP